MGLKEILNDISRDSEELNNESLNAAIIETDKRIIEAAEEIDKRMSEAKEVLAAEIKRKRIKLTAKAELETYRDRQKMEVNLIDRILEESLKELIRQLKQNREGYLNFLKKLVRLSADLIGSIPVEVSLSKDDIGLFSELAKDFREGELVLKDAVKIDGGVICSSGGSYVDNSLENIFERKRPVFLKMISEELG